MRSSRLIAVACAIAASAHAAAAAQGEAAEEGETAPEGTAAEKTAPDGVAPDATPEEEVASGGEPAGGDGAAGAFSHRGQIGLHLALGAGYRGIFPYDGEFCGDVKDEGGNAASCLGRSPLAADLGLAYGLTDRIEALFELRLGLERDIGTSPADDDGPRAVAIAPGVKAYLADVGRMMFFSTVQLTFDFTSFDQVDGSDLGARNVNGLHLDLDRRLGLLFYFGEQVSWQRWLRFEVEAGLGAQVRFL